MLSGKPTQQSNAITASDGVADSYYDIPVIRAPNWHWLAIVYLFVGGIAGGSYAIATLAQWFSRDRKLIQVARYISLAAFLPSPILLILDLGRPDRFLHMLRIIKLRSPLSLGSWALTLFSPFVGGLGVLQLLGDVFGWTLWERQRRIIATLGMPVALFFSGYTGLLLAITNIPVWARNSLLLAPTFFASAFSTAMAAISGVLSITGTQQPETERALARAECICIATELTLLTAGIVRLGKLGRPLTAGRCGRIFWPVTYIGGLLVPLLLTLEGPARGKEVSPARRRITSLLVLTGGFGLRATMMFAGHESANRPEDYFEYTKLSHGSGNNA